MRVGKNVPRFFEDEMFGVGVASFSHMAGMHYQNSDDWNEYIAVLQDTSI